MPENEKVTREELEWIEQYLCAGDHISARALSETMGDTAAILLRSILAKCPTIEESPNESTCREIRARVRAAYARQQEPTKAEQVAFAAAELVRKAGSFLTDNVETYGRKPATIRADHDGRWQIKDSSGRVVAEGFPRKAPAQATPAPETNPPIGGKAWSGKPESAIPFLEMEWKSGGTHPTPTWHLAINPEIYVELRGATFIAGGQVPETGFAKCVDAQFYCEEWLRTKTSPLHAARYEKALREELARTKAALEAVKRDDSGLRAALEKCERTLEGARVHHIGATAGIQWADIVLPGGLLVRVKGGAK